MDPSTDKRTASRLLAGLENGGMAATDAAWIAQNLDPVLLHLIVTFLRECYPASDPAANSVLDRLVQLTAAYPTLVEKCKEGEQDSVSAWIESEHELREFKGRGAELIAIVVDKLES